MGAHAYARLGYGYDLGGDEGEYRLREDVEDLPWYDEDLGLEDSATKALLAVVGFTEDDYEVDGYYERRKEALKKIGSIHFQYYGNLYTGYTGTLLFAGPSLSKNWVESIEIPEITDAHRERLAWALEVLGLTPEQDEPGWLLATNYG
jgi:hypothetical protein